MEEKDIVEAEFTEVSEELELHEDEIAVKEDAPTGKMGLDAFLSAITSAVASEQITSSQAREIRQGMGIRQGYFTRNRNSDAAKTKAKRKTQKNARKASRKKK